MHCCAVAQSAVTGESSDLRPSGFDGCCCCLDRHSGQTYQVLDCLKLELLYPHGAQILRDGCERAGWLAVGPELAESANLFQAVLAQVL